VSPRDGFVPLYIVCSRWLARRIGALDPERADITATHILIILVDGDGSMLWEVDPDLQIEGFENQ
jgi:hypothetical protein